LPTGLSTELRDHVECPRNTCVAIGYECPRSSDAGVAWDVSSLVGPPPSGRAHKPTYERGEWGPSTWPPTGASIGLSVVGIFHGHETTMADPPPASSRREVRHSGRKDAPPCRAISRPHMRKWRIWLLRKASSSSRGSGEGMATTNGTPAGMTRRRTDTPPL
jgi:hypothetical protein